MKKSDRYFITDNGKSHTVKFTNGDDVYLSRYGVWDRQGRKPHVIDQDDDVEMLMQKYEVSTENVIII